MIRPCTKPAEPLEMGFASYQDGTFELILRDPKTGHETTLHGMMQPGQVDAVDKILPSCVFINRLPLRLP